MPLLNYLMADTERGFLLWPLLLNTFVTGMLDATSFGSFGVFSSNQTGNVIILISQAIGVRRDRSISMNCFAPPLLTTGVSLAGFLSVAFLVGRFSLRYGNLKRLHLCISTLAQSLLILATAIVIRTAYTQNSMSNNNASFDALPVALLALSAGLQVAQARCSGVNEVPTAMLTSPIVDLLTHKDLFAPLHPNGDPSVFSRNVRVAYVLVFVVGIAFGATLHRFAGVSIVAFVAFGLRLSAVPLFLR